MLAVTALLISTTTIGTYRMVFDARFKDVMMNSASWLQMQYEEARSGIRPNCDSGVNIGTSSKVLLGRVIRFSDNGTNSIIESYPVIGDDGADDNYYYDGNDTWLQDFGAFSNIEVKIDCKTTKELDWQARATNLFTYSSSDNDDDPVNFNTILLIRNPRSTNLRSYFGNTTNITDLQDKVSANLQAITGTGSFITAATGFQERGAVIISNGDSDMFQSLGVICIDPGANSTNVWGARGLEATGAREMLTGDPLKDIVKTVRAKCNE